ncbi:MAG TPA: thioredoxin fold domain-containing protein [Planctomycetota bacterium]|nr:thioredoxin fold domain-containing protein [Planctomycetota bacterium]
MKSAILTATLIALAAPAAMAQSLEEKKAEKLKAEFFKKADWNLDYDKAREESKKSGKPIFALFSRSYAPCPACHQLENGPLLTDDFAKFAKDYVLFCHITTMIQGEKYGDLLEEKGGTAFPWLVFMDATGEIITEHHGARSASEFAKTGETAKSWLALKEKAAKGDPAAQIDFAILQLSMGQVAAEDAAKTIKAAGKPTGEQQARYDAELVNAEVREAVRQVKSDEEAAALGKRFYARHKEGKPAPTSDSALQSYYILILEAAGESKDAATFEATYKILFEKYGKMEGAGAFFEEKEKQLKELQKK